MNSASIVSLSLVLCAVACSKSDPSPQPAPVQSEIKDSGPLEKLEAPVGVLAFGGIKQPTKTAALLSRFLEKATGAQSKPAMIAKALARNLGLKNATAINLDKPLHFVLLAPDRYPGARCLSFGTNGRQTLIEALPKAQPLDQEGGYRFTGGSGKELHLGLIDAFAVVCENGRFLRDQREFMKRLLGSSYEGRAVAMLSLDNVALAYAKELKSIPERIKKLERAGRRGAETGRAVARFIKDMGNIKMLKLHIRESEDHGLLGKVEVQPKEGLAKSKKPTSRPIDATKLAMHLPTSTVAGFLGQLPSEGFSTTMQPLEDWLFRLSLGQGVMDAKRTAERIKKYQRAYFKATTGEFGLAMFRNKEQGLKTLLFAKLRDEQAAKKALSAVFGAATKTAKATARPATKDSKKSVWRVREGAYEVEGTPVTVVEHPWIDDTKKMAKDPSAAGAAIRELQTSFAESHIVFRNSMQLVVFGKGAKTTITRWLEGKLKGGFHKQPAFLRAKQHLAQDPSLVFFGSPMQFARSLPFRPLQSALATIPTAGEDATTLTVSIGGKKSKREMVVDLPAEQARSLVQLLTLSRGLR